jgi:hypothetical protein
LPSRADDASEHESRAKAEGAIRSRLSHDLAVVSSDVDEPRRVSVDDLMRPPRLPERRSEYIAFAAAELIGLAIWLPAMAAEPRYSRGHQGSDWYFPAMFAAAAVLGVVFWRQWQVLPMGLLSGQIVLAPWTTPRGDDDGMWVLIFVFLLAMGFAFHLMSWGIAWFGSAVARWSSRLRR